MMGWIGNKLRPAAEWHAALIDAVRQVTHIAPADENNELVGLKVAQEGVVVSSSDGKGKGVTNASFATTTEVYPDSKAVPVTNEQCNRAQVAAVVGGLEYIVRNGVSVGDACGRLEPSQIELLVHPLSGVPVCHSCGHILRLAWG